MSLRHPHSRSIIEQFPASPSHPESRVEYVAYMLAIEYPRGQHGQLCPVWTKKADIDKCDCWRLRNALAAARGAIKALETYDAMSASVEHKADRVGNGGGR